MGARLDVLGNIERSFFKGNQAHCMDYRAEGLDLRITFLGVAILCDKCMELQMLYLIKLLRFLFSTIFGIGVIVFML